MCNWKEKIEWNDETQTTAKETLDNYVEFIDNFDSLSGKFTMRHKNVYCEGEKLNWKNEKKLIKYCIEKYLNIDKPNSDLMYVAVTNVAKRHVVECDYSQMIAIGYQSEFNEIEELIDDIINNETIDERNDWEIYRDWKNNEALKIKNADGEVVGIDPCYDNLVQWLEHFPLTKNAIFFNDKSTRIDYNGKILDDSSIHTILSQCNKYFIRKYSSVTKMFDAIKGFANKKHYHPVKEYFESLKYDDSRDWFEYLIKEVLKAELWDEYGDLYLAEFRKWIFACVKRIYEPGCKFDNILVLVSENQGTGKSSIWERLFKINDEPYCKIVDASQEIPSGDRFIQQCAAKMCINFDEIAVKAKNVNKIKTMLSQQNDEWHTLYSVADAPRERDFVFVGSTNNTDILKDYTSMFERRWWFIKVTEDTSNGVRMNAMFDDEQLNLRDNIWAQAKHMYDNKQESALYIVKNTELGEKLEKLQRGYKASNNEFYDEIKRLMDMQFGFTDINRAITVDSIVKQYKHGDTLDYCKRRNKEIYNNLQNDNYSQKPDDIYYRFYGKVDRWPATILYDILKKLGIDFTKQSLANELKFDAVFTYKNARIFVDDNNSMPTKCWVRDYDSELTKIIDDRYEGETDNAIPF